MNSGIVNDAKTNIEYAVTGTPDDALQSLHKNKTIAAAKERIDHVINGSDNLTSNNTNEVDSKRNIRTEEKAAPSISDNKILRHPSVQSKSQVEVRIKSDKPVEITRVKSDKNTDMMVDTGNLLGEGF